MASTQPPRTAPAKGVSLSRGPALLLGSALLVAGLYGLYRAHSFPALSRFGHSHAPIDVRVFHVFGINGWSAELTAVAGGVLLFCAAHHILAKTASFVVGVALAGVALIALGGNHSALGLFAAGIWTIVLWGACALALLLNVLSPRAGRRRAAGYPVYAQGAPAQGYAPAPGVQASAATPAAVYVAPAPAPAPASAAAPARAAVPERSGDLADLSTGDTFEFDAPTAVLDSDAPTAVMESDAPSETGHSEAPTVQFTPDDDAAKDD